MKFVEDNNSEQKFIWPETNNPIIKVVRMFGRSSIFIFLILAYLSNRYLKTKVPFLIIFDCFLLSMSWIFLQQKLKVYKILGWTIVFVAIWTTLVELNVFAITPWW